MMKNILVPTDFSDYANNACLVAINLAKKTMAEVHFFHMEKLPEEWVSQEVVDPAIAKHIDEINRKLDDLVTKARHQGLNSEKWLSFSESSNEIVNQIEKNKHDFVVMGSHGIHGLEELFIGSYAQKVVRQSTVPVLVVKDLEADLQISNIVFASDFEDEVRESFEEVLEFAEVTDAKVHLLFINTPGNFTDTSKINDKMDKFTQLNPKRTVSADVYNSTYDVEDGLLLSCNEKNADVIAMVTHGRKGFIRLIRRSITETIINYSKIPVLSLPIRGE